MLDQLRTHAKSWVVKLVLGLIILSFMLFFGYSRISSRYHEERQYVATVGHEGVPRRAFDAYYQGALDKMREGLKGEMPEGMTGFLKQNIIHQLVMREVVAQYGDDLGLMVSDEEVAQFIRAQKNFFNKEGKFDIITYERQFLPYYQQKYGENYEEMVRKELMMEKVQLLALSLFTPWNRELDKALSEISSNKDKKTDKKKEPETAKTPLTSISPEELLSQWVKDFQEKVKVEVLDPSGQSNDRS